MTCLIRKIEKYIKDDDIVHLVGQYKNVGKMGIIT